MVEPFLNPLNVLNDRNVLKVFYIAPQKSNFLSQNACKNKCSLLSCKCIELSRFFKVLSKLLRAFSVHAEKALIRAIKDGVQIIRERVSRSYPIQQDC